MHVDRLRSGGKPPSAIAGPASSLQPQALEEPGLPGVPDRIAGGVGTGPDVQSDRGAEHRVLGTRRATSPASIRSTTMRGNPIARPTVSRLRPPRNRASRSSSAGAHRLRRPCARLRGSVRLGDHRPRMALDASPAVRCPLAGVTAIRRLPPRDRSSPGARSPPTDRPPVGRIDVGGPRSAAGTPAVRAAGHDRQRRPPDHRRHDRRRHRRAGTAGGLAVDGVGSRLLAAGRGAAGHGRPHHRATARSSRPGFIDLHSHAGLDDPRRSAPRAEGPPGRHDRGDRRRRQRLRAVPEPRATSSASSR